MRPETVGRIERLLNEIWDHLRRANEVSSREALVKRLRDEYKEKNDAEFYVRKAQQSISFEELSEINAANLHEQFGWLETIEKQRHLLLGIPQDRAKAIEMRLMHIRHQLLSQLGGGLVEAGEQLGKKPVGRPSKMPPDEECRTICVFIVEQNARNKVPVGIAQERAAARWGFKLRTIQRIWARRDELLGRAESDVND